MIILIKMKKSPSKKEPPKEKAFFQNINEKANNLVIYCLKQNNLDSYAIKIY